MSIHSSPWESMGIHSSPWESMGIHSSPWESVGIHSSPWESVGIHSSPWESVGIHSSPWESVGIHSSPWESVGIHGLSTGIHRKLLQQSQGSYPRSSTPQTYSNTYPHQQQPSAGSSNPYFPSDPSSITHSYAHSQSAPTIPTTLTMQSGGGGGGGSLLGPGRMMTPPISTPSEGQQPQGYVTAFASPQGQYPPGVGTNTAFDTTSFSGYSNSPLAPMREGTPSGTSSKKQQWIMKAIEDTKAHTQYNYCQ
ncbi:hypothetical protein K435DRAFT_877149 [Dendrothele bispora CBS 962.96]|uniref:Uncharacterized protein n=1 Tax=Dendrothele bispora (strain CBS 962.96) TaxID=1314807 RepID=A0A4S8KQH2_DENBC|nr:hypothetical protein K435DRAFT_877149 [Dendrothele bispora CBS 962.96]